MTLRVSTSDIAHAAGKLEPTRGAIPGAFAPASARVRLADKPGARSTAAARSADPPGRAVTPPLNARSNAMVKRALRAGTDDGRGIGDPKSN